MRAALDALHARLAATPAFWGGLSIYRGSRALFAADKVPVDAARPYGTIFGPIGSAPFDTKVGALGQDDPAAATGHLLTFDVNVYADANGDPRDVDALALAAQQAIHRRASALVVVGWSVLVASAAAPVIAPTDDSIYGRRVAVALTLRPA